MKDLDILVVRENPAKHPILSAVCASGIIEKTYNFKQLSDWLSILKLIFSKKKVMCSDPIVALFFFHKNITFLSLEMFEFQRNDEGALNKIRNYVFKLAHRFILMRSDKIVFPNKIRCDYYCEIYNIDKKRTFIVPNLPGKDVLNKVSTVLPQRNELIDSIRSMEGAWPLLNMETVIYTYFGTINDTNRGLSVIIDAVTELENSVLLLAGPDRTKKLAVNKWNGRSLYLGELEQSRIFSILKSADYGFLYYGSNNLNTRYCAPVKIFEYINCGTKIVANRVDGLYEYSGVINCYLEDDGEVVLNKEYSTDLVKNYFGRFYEEEYMRITSR